MKEDLDQIFYDECETMLGDTDIQSKHIDKIIKGAKSGNKIFIICGPIRSGKGTIYKKVKEASESNNLSVHEFTLITPTTKNFVNKARYDQDKNYVVRISEDGDLPNAKDALFSAFNYLEDLKKVGSKNISFIIELLRHDPIVPAQLIPNYKEQSEQIYKFIGKLKNENKNIEILNTHYDLNRVKEKIWDIFPKIIKNGYSPEESIAGIQDEFFNNVHIDKRIVNMLNALKSENQKLYDISFDQLARTFKKEI